MKKSMSLITKEKGSIILNPKKLIRNVLGVERLITLPSLQNVQQNLLNVISAIRRAILPACVEQKLEIITIIKEKINCIEVNQSEDADREDYAFVVNNCSVQDSGLIDVNVGGICRAVARTLIGGVYIHIFGFCPTNFF